MKKKSSKKKTAPTGKNKKQQQVPKKTRKEEQPRNQRKKQPQQFSLIGLIEVADVSSFLTSLVSAVDGGRPCGLGPVLALYMAFRHRLSPAHFRPELSPAKRSELLTDFIAKTVAILHDTVKRYSQSIVAMMTWLANTAELHHLLTSDRNIGPIMRRLSGAQQEEAPLNEQLAEVALAAFGHLLSLIREQLRPVVGQLFDEGMVDAAAIEGCRQVFTACIQQLASANVTQDLALLVFDRLYYFVGACLLNQLMSPAGASLCTSAVGRRLERRLELLLADKDAVVWPEFAKSYLTPIFEAAQMLQALATAERMSAWAPDGLLERLQMLSGQQVQTLARQFRADDGGPPADDFAVLISLTMNIIHDGQVPGERLLKEDVAAFLLPFRPGDPDDDLDDYETDERIGISAIESCFLSELQSRGVCRVIPMLTASNGKWSVHFARSRSSSLSSSSCSCSSGEDDDDDDEETSDDETPKMPSAFVASGFVLPSKKENTTAKTAQFETAAPVIQKTKPEVIKISRQQEDLVKKQREAAAAKEKQRLQEAIDDVNEQLTKATEAEKMEKRLVDRLQKGNAELREKVRSFDDFAGEKQRSLLDDERAVLRDRLRSGAKRLDAIEDRLNAAIHRTIVAEASLLTLKCQAEVAQLERRRMMAVENRDQGRTIAQSLRAKDQPASAVEWQRYQHDWDDIANFIAAVIDQVNTDFSHQKERIGSGKVSLAECAPVRIPPMPPGPLMPHMEEEGDEEVEEIDGNHREQHYHLVGVCAADNGDDEEKGPQARGRERLRIITEKVLEKLPHAKSLDVHASMFRLLKEKRLWGKTDGDGKKTLTEVVNSVVLFMQSLK